MDIDIPVWDRKQKLTLIVAILLVLTWIFLPLYLQSRFKVSAIEVSFGITIVYYIGFKLWKHFSA